MPQYALLKRPQLIEWNCNQNIFADGVPELNHVLDHYVQGQVHQLVGTLEYGAWAFWHRLCIAVILKGELTSDTDGPVNDSLLVTWLDQAAFLQTHIDIEQKQEIANHT